MLLYENSNSEDKTTNRVDGRKTKVAQAPRFTRRTPAWYALLSILNIAEKNKYFRLIAIAERKSP